MKINHLFLVFVFILSGFMQPAIALPDMAIVDAKATLLSRKNTPLGKQFKERRITDIPSFDAVGVGNYHAQYELDSGKKLMIWMYVERTPPTVDEVVLFVNKAKPEDVTNERAMALLNLVYSESNSGSSVIKDFEKAIENHKEAIDQINKYNKSLKATKAYLEEHGPIDLKEDDLSKIGEDIFKSDKEAKDAYREFSRATKYYIPTNYDKSIYYMGLRFGYRARYHKGGFELGIYNKDVFAHTIEEIQTRLPKYGKVPEPVPSKSPPPPEEEVADIDW